MSDPRDPHQHQADHDAVPYDVVVVGGGPAGLSAALALGRARRRVLVVDAGEPRNAPAAHMHGVLGHDGLPPHELLALGRAEVARYGVEVVDGRAVDARRLETGFEVDLADGRTVAARRIVVSSGATDQLPDVPGVRERWGRDVVHCPYCHGWEVRDTSIAVIGGNTMAAHGALLFRQWSERVALFLLAGVTVTNEERRKLTARGIPVIDDGVDSIVVTDDRIVGVRLSSGDEYPADTVVVASRVIASSAVLDALGLAAGPNPMGADMGTAYTADATGRTEIAGVWAAGNVVNPMATVPASAAAGYLTGALVNAELIEEETEWAVAEASSHPPMDATFWDERYRAAPALWSGNPNPTLVAEASALPPGRALDVGAGEGGDAIWLAERGWEVVAHDVSAVAVERGAAHAAERGPEVASRITWVHGDAAETALPSGPFDLVTCHFVHLAADERAALFRDLAAAVAPGGRLLIVAHHPSDLGTTIRRPRRPDLFSTASEIAATLDDDVAVVVAEARPRRVRDGDGNEVTIRDTVLVAERRR